MRKKIVGIKAQKGGRKSFLRQEARQIKSKKIVHIRTYLQIVMQCVSRVGNAMTDIRTKETQQKNM